MRIILAILLITASLITKAQWTPNGNIVSWNGLVGINTNVPEATGLLTIDAGFNDNAKQGVYIKAMAGTNNSGPSIILDNRASWTAGRSFIRGISRANSTTVYTDVCLHNGMMGINTNYPDATLTVNGSIHSKEVRVDLNIIAPDYVFAPDYKLPSLTEVAAYINQHKHLPEVPSAKEMETNGVKLGEMNMLLLKKIEELTLYVLEQNNKIADQQTQLQAQQVLIELLLTKSNDVEK